MQRETRQRKLIMEILSSSMDHPDALTVFRRAQDKKAKVSIGTVYRTLELLVKEGKALKFYDANAVARYDAKVDFHHHLICRVCGKVEDLDASLFKSDQMIKEIEEKTHFKDIEYHLTIYGICEDCAKRGNRES